MSTPGWMALTLLATVFLCGCAATTQSASATRGREPDCSFRAATTCWTLGGRFPAPHADGRDSVPTEVLKQPPTLLATGVDSAAASR